MKRMVAPPGRPRRVNPGGRRVVRTIMLVSWLVCLTGFGLPALAQTVYVTANVPTDPSGPAVSYLPWQIIKVDTGYSLELSVPGQPAIDAIHKMDKADNWLFSVEAPNGLGGALGGGAIALPHDVVRYDAGAYSLFFEGSCVSPAVPKGSNVNAIAMREDNGVLAVVFNVPTDVAAATTSLPSGWAVYQRSGGGGPCDWTQTATQSIRPYTTTYVPEGARITGLALRSDGAVLLTFDVPTDVSPPAQMVLPGQVAQVFTGTPVWSVFKDLQAVGAPGWPVSSVVDALSCLSNPGGFDVSAGPSAQIKLGKSATNAQITCPAGCSSGAEGYGIYTGTIGSWPTYDHTQSGCATVCDGSTPNNVALLTSSSSEYYLVVANNSKSEGSYGLDSSTNQRPRAAGARCATAQILSSCP